jgi:ribosomal 30S subunit maturation factor RimM
MSGPINKFKGFAADEKPKASNGNVVKDNSEFFELDTGNYFIYDLATDDWYPA